MTITQRISIDLQQPGNAPMIHAVQGDEYTRVVEIDLYSGGVAWNPPSGCEVVIRYGKPDGKGGVYGTLPDDTSAWSIDGNTISVILAPQMLTVPGFVKAQVLLIVDQKQLVSTFHFVVNVEEDSSKGAVKSENYVNWKTYYIPQTKNATVGQYLKISKVDADGRVIEVVPVDAPSGGYEGGDLDLDGNVIIGAGEVEFVGDPENSNTNFTLSGSGFGIDSDGVNRPVAVFGGANNSDPVVLTNIAPGSTDMDVANIGQLKTRLPAPLTAAAGQYIRITAVDENGAVTAVEAVDAPSGGGGSDEVFVKMEDGTVASAEVEFDLSEDNTPALVVAPPTAEVGQTIVVKAVDENGKPTEWEAVDLPAGGSESGWELVANLTVEEAVQSITWDNLNYRELKIFAYNPEGTGGDAYVEPKVNGIALGSLADSFAFPGNFFSDKAVSAEIRVFAFGDFAMLSLNDLRVFSKEAIGKYGEISSFTWTSFGTPENDTAIRAGGRYIVYGRK